MNLEYEGPEKGSDFVFARRRCKRLSVSNQDSIFTAMLQLYENWQEENAEEADSWQFIRFSHRFFTITRRTRSKKNHYKQNNIPKRSSIEYYRFRVTALQTPERQLPRLPLSPILWELAEGKRRFLTIRHDEYWSRFSSFTEEELDGVVTTINNIKFRSSHQ